MTRTVGCRFFADSLRDQLGGVLIDVELELLIELCFEPGPVPQATPPDHLAPASDSSRISPTASARRRQLAVCASSVVRPLRVRR
jgi:hypothetical protein